MSKSEVEKNLLNIDMKALIPLISKEFKKYFTKNIKALYHYTNLEGAQGIISDKTFWASHINL